MNDITKLTHSNGSGLTMSTIEIAEITDKRHDNVMNVAKRLKEKGIINAPKIKERYNKNNSRSIFRLDKVESLNLVANLSPEFTARIISRWLELETERGQPVFEIPSTLPEALRLAAELGDRASIAETALLETQPKADFFDRFCNADGLYGLQNAGRALECRPNLFVRWLKSKYLFYQGGNLVPKVAFIQNGIFEVKTIIVDDKVRPQAYITPKGLKKLADCLPDEIRLREMA